MAKKEKVRKYKCFNITSEELDAIRAGSEQMRDCSEASDEEYAEWASEQMKLIYSFLSKVKLQ